MTDASEIQALRRRAASRGLRLSKRGEDFYLFDADTGDIVLGWSDPGGVHLDEVKAYLRNGSHTRIAWRTSS
jgi:hypothetical protein